MTQPTSGDFIRKHDLPSPSSVSTSLKALAEKEIIVFDIDRWNVYDVFFQDGLSIIIKSKTIYGDACSCRKLFK